MKHVNMLGSLVVAVGALMAFAGPASATITFPTGTAYTGNIHMTGTGIAFHTGGDVKCKDSTLVGSVTNGGTTIPINQLTFSECGSATVTVLKAGYLSIASDGTASLSGTEYTKMTHSVIGTVHCVLRLEETVFGVLTEGVNPATLHTDSYEIPSTSTDFGCGSSAELTGLYTVTQPTGAITID